MIQKNPDYINSSQTIHFPHNIQFYSEILNITNDFIIHQEPFIKSWWKRSSPVIHYFPNTIQKYLILQQVNIYKISNLLKTKVNKNVYFFNESCHTSMHVIVKIFFFFILSAKCNNFIVCWCNHGHMGGIKFILTNNIKANDSIKHRKIKSNHNLYL